MAPKVYDTGCSAAITGDPNDSQAPDAAGRHALDDQEATHQAPDDADTNTGTSWDGQVVKVKDCEDDGARDSAGSADDNGSPSSNLVEHSNSDSNTATVDATTGVEVLD